MRMILKLFLKENFRFCLLGNKTTQVSSNIEIATLVSNLLAFPPVILEEGQQSLEDLWWLI